MPNMSLDRVGVPKMSVKDSLSNFNEIFLGYTEDMALEEADRCIGCKHKPCVNGCPIGVKIPEFIVEILKKDYLSAYNIISESSFLPSVCSRVCPQEEQCEMHCVRGIKGSPVSIGHLERFVSDWYYNTYVESNEIDNLKLSNKLQKVAIIGSGPCGLTAAYCLAKKGYRVTVFESYSEAGGILRYGIPKFRLPDDILDIKIKELENLSVRFKYNKLVGKDISLENIFDLGYKSIFISCGLPNPIMMGIEGEDLNNVYNADEYLKYVNSVGDNYIKNKIKLDKIETIYIIGGGNVAMDAARSSVRLGIKSVNILYRRTENEMPAREEEILFCKEEGIKIHELVNPLKILSNGGSVCGVECIQMELGAEDSSGRPSVKPIGGSNFIIEADAVVMAIGNSGGNSLKDGFSGINLDKYGNISTDESLQTSIEGVFAGGDVVSGAKTVVLAMKYAIIGANSIDSYLKNKEEVNF